MAAYVEALERVGFEWPEPQSAQVRATHWQEPHSGCRAGSSRTRRTYRFHSADPGRNWHRQRVDRARSSQCQLALRAPLHKAELRCDSRCFIGK